MEEVQSFGQMMLVGQGRRLKTEHLILTQRSLLTFIWFSKMVEARSSTEQEDRTFYT